MNKDIEQALRNFRGSAGRYAKAERYYNGDHDLAFATEKFQNTFGTLFREFALNLCPVICDAVRDKLRVVGFSADSFGVAELQSARVKERNSSRVSSFRVPESDAANSEHSGNTPNSANSVDSVNSATRSIWQRNRMATRSGEIHKEALKCGDAYMIVWPDENGRAVMYPNRASGLTVIYDEDPPGRIAWAAKYWRAADKRIRLNLLYPDRIEKYVSPKSDSPRSRIQSPMSGGPDFSTLDFVPWTLDGDSAVPNPYGIVPVFHFANNADIGMPGRSELDAAIPVQDGLNKSVLDMLVAMEFSAYRQRWAAGIEFEIDSEGKPVAPFKAGVDHLWIVDNPNAKFGDFDAAHLEQFLKVKDGFRSDIASVTGTPMHYLLPNTGDLPSGASLRQSETRFLAKVLDRQTAFGQVWADVLAFALQIEGQSGVRLLTEWADPAPMSEREVLENILLKKQIGLSTEQALIEAGYGAADVNQMTQ